MLVIFCPVGHDKSEVESVRERSYMMAFLYTLAHKLHNDKRGQDLVEYALLAGFIGVAAGAIFPTTLMPGVSTIFSKLASSFTVAASQGS